MEKIYSAKTLDEAKAFALNFFTSEGFDESDIDFEIIEQPVKKFFGTRGEYRIRAVADDDLLIKKTVHEKLDTPINGKNSTDVRNNNTKSNFSNNKGFQTDEKKHEENSTSSGESYEKYSVAISYLTNILNGLGAENFKINVIEKEELTILDIVGEKLGIAIGRRGETLDSLQYLTILANNRKNEQYTRISVDCNGYREKRRETLESLAERTAQKVLKQGRRITLEPMNPYERRIIHSKVSEMEGVYSNSIGEEPYRKVVVSANIPKQRRDGVRREGRDNFDTPKNNRERDDRPKTPNTSSGKSYRQSNGYSTSFEREYKRAPSEPIEISQDTVDMEKNTSLFGKIEL